MTDAARLADRFVDHDGIYMLSHSIGLPLRGSREAALEFFDAWEYDTVQAWPRWLESIDGFRRSLARLLGTHPASICPQSNVSSGLTKILGSIGELPHRPTVLISEDAFPSLGYVFQQAGCRLRYIDRAFDATDAGVWRDHLGSADIVLITHVQSNTGQLVPVEEIVELARTSGTITIVDVAQSVGVIPIDLSVWNADFVVGSCVKWLSGGPGAGWLWGSPERIGRSRPRDVGWFSHADPFEFDIHRFQYADDALRFWGGSPTVLPFAVARHAVDTIDAIGVDTIRAHNIEMSDHLIDGLGQRIVSPHQAGRRGGTCIVTADATASDRLAHAGIAVDARTNGVRVSPHVHVGHDDIEAFIGQFHG